MLCPALVNADKVLQQLSAVTVSSNEKGSKYLNFKEKLCKIFQKKVKSKFLQISTLIYYQYVIICLS